MKIASGVPGREFVPDVRQLRRSKPTNSWVIGSCGRALLARHRRLLAEEIFLLRMCSVSAEKAAYR